VTHNDSPLEQAPDRQAHGGDASKTLVLGIGCERLAPIADVLALAESCLAEAGVDPQHLACLATLSAKATEPAIQAVAAYLNVPICAFTAEQLEAETPRLANPSAAVFRITGCHGVAEGAALAGVGSRGHLILPKRIGGRATCAIAQSAERIDPLAIDQRQGYDGSLIIRPGSGQAAPIETKD
jgi:cobalt-precorrin 5A hydrolase/precorrin-3B C17-methyltransferase